MQEIEIPGYVNDMPSFFMWQVDEFVCLIGIILIGYVMGGLWLFAFIFLGFWVASRLKKWKRRELDGVIPHMLHEGGFAALNPIYKNPHKGEVWL